MSRFGDILSELREDRGLTQKQLAEKFHVSNSSISSLETGYRGPSVEMLINLASYFNVTTDYLLGLCDEPVSPSIFNKQIDSTTTVSDAIKMIDNLTDTQKTALLCILKDMSIVADLIQKAAHTGEKK